MVQQCLKLYTIVIQKNNIAIEGEYWMKILILTSYSSVYGGNFIPSMEVLSDFAKNKGDTVFFALLKKAATRNWCSHLEKQYPVYYVQDEGLLNDALALNKYIKANKIDVVYSHFSYFNKLICLLSFINPKLTIVSHVHTDAGGGLTTKRKIKAILKKFLYKKRSMIYVSKRLMCMDLMENSPNAFYLPNALVKFRFDLNKQNEYRQEERKKFNIADDEIVLLMFGWHLSVKGVDIALKAFEKVLANKKNLKLCIVSSSNLKPEGLRNYAEKIVNQDTLKNIICLEPTQDVEKYHDMSDIFLSSSRSEGFSYSIMEGVYLKELIVSSDLESTSWSKKYETVEVFQTENIEMCAEKIETQIYNLLESDIEDRLNKASDAVSKDYDINIWASKVYDIIYQQWHKN